MTNLTDEISKLGTKNAWGGVDTGDIGLETEVIRITREDREQGAEVYWFRYGVPYASAKFTGPDQLVLGLLKAAIKAKAVR